MEKRSIKRYIVIAFVLLCVIVPEFLFANHFSNNYKIKNKSYDVSQIKKINGYEVNGNDYVPLTDDPSFVLKRFNTPVNAITVKFSKPLEENTRIDVYYARKGQRFVHSQLLSKNLEPGDDSYTADFADGMFKNIRFDINGSFSLEGFEVQCATPVRSMKRVLVFALVFVLIDALLLFILLKYYDNIFGFLLELKPEKLFIFWGLLIGLTFSTLMPGFQVPDELTHFEMIGNELGNSAYYDQVAVYYREINAWDISGNVGVKEDLDVFLERMERSLIVSEPFHLQPGILVLRHLPTAIVTAICMFFKTSVFWCLTISEWVNLLIYLIFGYFAIKLMPVKKNLFMMIMLLPMTMQQVASINYDTTAFALTFFLIGYILNIKYVKEKFGFKDIFIMLPMFLIVTLIKAPYVLVGLLVFTIPHEKYNLFIGKFDLGKLLYKLRFVFAGLLALGIIAVFGFVDTNISYISMLKATIFNPLHFFEVMGNTLFKYYGVYIGSFFGCFGWLDTRFPDSMYPVFMAVMLFMTLVPGQYGEAIKEKTGQKVLYILVFLGACSLIFIAMFDWVIRLMELPITGDYETWKYYFTLVEDFAGIQGRYFIPIAILPLLCIPGIKKLSAKVVRCVELVYYPVLFVLCFVTLLQRYWIPF